MINPISHYSIENPPTVYDEESLTALQLCARTAGKVNEVVREHNKHLQDFEAFVAGISSIIGDKVQEYIVGGYFDKQVQEFYGRTPVHFASLEELKQATVHAGMVAVTRGYYEENDGGGAVYVIGDLVSTYDMPAIDVEDPGYEDFPGVEAPEYDSGSLIRLGKTHKAMLIVGQNVDIRQFGAKAVTDYSNTTHIQEALDYAIRVKRPLYIPQGMFMVDNTLTLADSVNIYGDGMSTQDQEKSCIVLRAGDENIPLLDAKSGITQLGRCTFTNVSFMRSRTTADGYPANERAYGKTGICFGFNLNETSIHRCAFVGFGTVCAQAHITDFIDCDVVYCDAIIRNTALCNAVNFIGLNAYACGVLLRARGNLSGIHFSNSWIEDFVILFETTGVNVYGLDFTGCTLTNTANGNDLLMYYNTGNTNFHRMFITFNTCLLYIKDDLVTAMPDNMESRVTFNDCQVHYGGQPVTAVKIYGNSKFMALDGSNTSNLSANSGIDTGNSIMHSPVQISRKSASRPYDLAWPNNYPEVMDKDGNRAILMPVYYEFGTPTVPTYFMYNTQAVSTGDWVLKYVHKKGGTNIEKIIVQL